MAMRITVLEGEKNAYQVAVAQTVRSLYSV